MTPEHRRYQRYRVDPDAYAAFGGEYSQVGKVKDISMGGLSFTSFSKDTDPDSKAAVIAIYLSGNHFYLPDLPCRVVYETPVDEYDIQENSRNVLAITKYGVEFGELKKKKKEELEFFISSYTMRERA